MAQPFNPKDLVTLEELTISNMREVVVVAMFDKKGLLPERKLIMG